MCSLRGTMNHETRDQCSRQLDKRHNCQRAREETCLMYYWDMSGLFTETENWKQNQLTGPRGLPISRFVFVEPQPSPGRFSTLPGCQFDKVCDKDGKFRKVECSGDTCTCIDPGTSFFGITPPQSYCHISTYCQLPM